jgi:hypothetical protein
MITLISTPEYVEPLDPTIISRWLATESPNNFRLLRRDFIVIPFTSVSSGSKLRFQLSDSYTGSTSNAIAVYDFATNSMKVGTVTAIGTVTLANDLITTSIDFVAGTNILYMNDNTLYGGYYFEGQLTVNGVIYPLTIIASPDSFGYADLDVSGILRIVTSIGKVGDYSARIMKETTKSGKFNFEYRECWYGYTGSWEGDVITSPIASPPIMNTWYYGECVRSEEQGSNLHDYVATTLNDAPFLNQFDQPVYFLGLPFDLSFIMPETIPVSPASDIIVTINVYDSANLLLHTITELVPVDLLEGYICSLNIDAALIPSGAAYFTAEITV